MTYQHKFIAAVLAGLMLGIVLPASVVIAVDPFRIYHESFLPGHQYSDNQRYQNSGLINTYLNPSAGYDTIIIGPSTSDNFYPEDIERAVHKGRALNLAINGSMPIQNAALARHALKTGHVHYLLWDLHSQFVDSPADTLPLENEAMPFYLYNENPFDDYPYIFNISNLLTSIRLLMGGDSAFRFNLNRTNAFYDSALINDEFSLYKNTTFATRHPLKKMQDAENSWISKPALGPESFQYESIDKNILDVIMPYCNDTQIDIALFFSPHHRMLYSAWPNARGIYSYVYMRRYLMEKTTQCSNISVYAFDNDDAIVDSIDNYMDYFHFDLSVNRAILDAINQGTHKITPDNIDDYENAFIRNVRETRLRLMQALGATERTLKEGPLEPKKLRKQHRKESSAQQ